MPEYNKLSAQIAQQLCDIVGQRRFQYGRQVKPEYAHDEMPIYGKFLPEAVCLAETTEELSAIMRICSENKIPVTVRGTGTGLVGGSFRAYSGLENERLFALEPDRVQRWVYWEGVPFLEIFDVEKQEHELIRYKGI